MGDLIVLSPVAVVLNEDTKIIHDAKIFVDDVLLSGTGILGSYDVQLLGRLCHFQHELKQPYCGFSGRCCPFQEFYRRITSEKGFVFI